MTKKVTASTASTDPTGAQTARDLAKVALTALRALAVAAEEAHAPRDVSKVAVRLTRRVETLFGRIVIWDELND